MNINFVKILDDFNNITVKPENFISSSSNHVKDIKLLLKDIYDFTKNEEEEKIKNALPELIVDNFDIEQIFQEVELQNEEFLDKSLKNVSKFSINRTNLIFNEVEKSLSVDEEEEVDDEDNKSSEENFDMESNDESEEEDGHSKENKDDLILTDSASDANKSDNEEKPVTYNRNKRKSIVDDEFFKLNEMEEFLMSEEKAMNKADKNDDSGNDSDLKEDDQIDYFEDDSELEDENDESLRQKNPRYKDFFRPNEETISRKRTNFMEEDEEQEEQEYGDVLSNSEGNIPEQKSTFELREERLKDKIKTLEDVALSEKPWQLRGEITAENRPQNSLLQEIVEFDISKRPAPVITETTTLQLEDIIRQRIKDRVFDSVERKQRPSDTPLEYKKKLVLEEGKSQKSLAQIYEDEYLLQKEAQTGESEDIPEEEPELHKEIKKMAYNLYRQLDAFCNFHFTPKPAIPELRIISNLPAINMEEVAPVATSDATLLAPEEVKKRIKGDIIGKSERSDTDKNRERRKKKIKQRIHAKEKKKKDMVNKLGLGNKYSKERAKKQLEKVTKEKNVDKMDESMGSKSIKSSTAFFQQLEEEIKTQINVKSQRKKQKITHGLQAKKLKL